MYSYTPFRKVYLDSNKKNKNSKKCIFCDKSLLSKQTIKNINGEEIKNSYYTWIINNFPKFEGHTMIVPTKHIGKLDEAESLESLKARNDIILFAIKNIQKLYPDCGIEVFLQFGPGSSSSIKHIHWHIVPANKNDKLRSFEKLGHFYTVKEDEKLIIDFPIKIHYAKKGLQLALSKVIGVDVI